jgi:beta-lactamase regulating signal transducer with metallopeptidase domain
MQTLHFPALNALTQALAWTVIHSLWQGVLVALLAALILWLMRFRSAKARYVVAYSSLFLLLTVVVLTFFIVFSTENRRYTEGSLLAQKSGDEAAWQVVQIVGNPSFIEKTWVSMHAFFSQNAALIATAWGLGFLFFGLRLAFGWHILRGRQRRGGALLDAHWQDILRQLQRQLSIQRPIPLVEAAWAQMPLTIGWLKPMIFLPIGLVNRLNPTEVEAILAHELAHIAGRDYFFNFLQAFVEVLLYYHPAVWWLSSVIRNERELRCDDVAIQLCGGNKLAYAKMLVALQEQFEALDAPPPKLALAFGKRPSFLLRRVKRLFNSPNKQSRIMEKMMITGLLLCGMFLFSFAKNGGNTEGSLSKPTAPKSVIEPTPTKLNSVVLKPIVAPLPTQIVAIAAIDTPPKSADATFKVFMPEDGTTRVVTVIGQTQAEFDKKQKEGSPKPIVWTVYASEFRRNDKEWYTINRKKSDRGVSIDTINWNKFNEKGGIIEGDWNKNSNLLTENDPSFRAFEDELLKDELIKNGQQYEVNLTENKFVIDANFIEKSYAEKYRQLYRKLYAPTFDGDGKYSFNLQKRDTISRNGVMAYGRGDSPKNPKEGSCYAKCKLPNGDFEEWREVICQHKITKEVIKTVISKLKADGCLDNSVESDEITKEIRAGVETFQKKYKLPVGNLNLETMDYLGIKL